MNEYGMCFVVHFLLQQTHDESTASGAEDTRVGRLQWKHTTVLRLVPSSIGSEHLSQVQSKNLVSFK